MTTNQLPHVPTADEAAAIVARRRAAEQRTLERREVRRQEHLRAERAAEEARAAARLAPRVNFYEESGLWPFALAELVAVGVARMAVGAARALRKAYCDRRETRAASLLGMPTPTQIEEAWTPPRRSLRQVLLIGSKLVDLSAAHPDTRQWSQDATGKRRLSGRAGGLKRYFEQHCPTVRYSTALRYRQLAQRLLRVLEIPAAIPLEWLLPEDEPKTLTTDATIADAIRKGRHKLWKLLADIHSQRGLARYLDRQLDPHRLPNVRRTSNPVRDAAASEAVFARFEAKLRAAVDGNRPLTRAEKDAWNQLRRLERLVTPPQP